MNPEIIAALSAFGGAMNTTTSTTNENAYVWLDKDGQHMCTCYPKPNAISLFEQLASKIDCTFAKKDPEYKAEDATFNVKAFK